jgi:hypothetical protein
MKSRTVETQLFYTDGQTDMTKLIVAYRNFSNAPKNQLSLKKWYVSFHNILWVAWRHYSNVDASWFHSCRRSQFVIANHRQIVGTKIKNTSDLSGAHPYRMQLVPGVQRFWLPCNNTSPSSFKPMNEWSFTSTPLYAFLQCTWKSLPLPFT